MNDLKNKIKGDVILPGDPSYDEARTIYNAMIDKRPGLIVKCSNTKETSLGLTGKLGKPSFPSFEKPLEFYFYNRHFRWQFRESGHQ